MPRIDAIRQIGVTEQTKPPLNRYRGMGTEKLKEPKRLQKENECRCRAVSYLMLNKRFPSEAARAIF